MGVSFSESAAARFKQLISENGQLPRIEIVAGGCNGFDKRFSMDERREDDIAHNLSNGAVVLMDPMTDMLLFNSIVDFRTGLDGASFSIEIPEAASTCGCGSSFSL